MQPDPVVPTTLAVHGWMLLYLYGQEEMRKKVLQNFRKNGALDPQRAITREQITGVPAALLRSLLGKGILKKTDGECYYLDEAKFLSRRRFEMRVAWMVAGVVLAGVCVFVWFNSLNG